MLKKYNYLFITTLLSLALYNLVLHKIYAFEFDTSFYFTMLTNLIIKGKVLMPVVVGSLPSICDTSLNCGFQHPNIVGQQLFTQLPAENTSGILLLFTPLLIHKIFSNFSNIELSLSYFIQLYSIGAALIYFATSSLLIINFNKIKYNLIKFFSLSCLSLSLIVQFSANGIVGELYSSIIISNVAIALLINIFNNKSDKFYYVCAVFLGIALEAKSSSLFPIGAILFILGLQRFSSTRKILPLFKIIIFFVTAKIFTFLYYSYIFNFDVSSLLKFISSNQAVYKSNAIAGLTWQGTGILKQLQMIILDEKIMILFIIGIFCLFLSIFISIYIKNKINILLSFFIILILLSSLVYPLIFKFPYIRILTPLVGLFPLAFLPLIININNFISNNRIKFLFFSLLLIQFSYFSYYMTPIRLPLFSLQSPRSFEPLSQSYPNFVQSSSDVFLSGHFFQTPWDIYLSSILDKNSPLNTNIIYGDVSIQNNITSIGNIYIIQTCRWGHCSQDNEIIGSIRSYKNTAKKLNCTLIPPANNNIYKLYKCIILIN